MASIGDLYAAVDRRDDQGGPLSGDLREFGGDVSLPKDARNEVSVAVT